MILVTLFCAVRARRRLLPVSGVLLAGIFFVDLILLFGTLLGDRTFSYALVKSFAAAIESVKGADPDTVAYPDEALGWISRAYRILVYSCFLLAPICTVGFLSTLFDKFMQRVKFRFVPRKNLHVFSALNNKSLALGEDILKCEPRARLTFCGVTQDNPFVPAAQRIAAIRLADEITNLTLRFGRCSFYAISASDDQNIGDARLILSKYAPCKQASSLYVFSSNLAFDELFDAAERGSVRLRLVDETKYVCYDQLSRRPLYDNIADGEIRALIVGAGSTGEAFFKALLWAGQIPGAVPRVFVVDRDAGAVQSRIRAHAPGLFSGGYDARFYAADAESDDFRTLLRTELSGVAYAVVCTGSDDGNIAAAEQIRQSFLRNALPRGAKKTFILVRIRDAKKAEAFTQYVENTGRKDMMACFGDSACTPCRQLSDNALERAARIVNRAYFEALDADEKETARIDRIFASREYNQRSSYAFALHIKYKLYGMGLTSDGVPAEKFAALAEERFADRALLERISIREHDRWAAFIFSEGYETADEETFLAYAPLVGAPVYHAAKLHPCLVSWDALDDVDGMVHKAFPSLCPAYKQTDRDIVLAIPAILEKIARE